MIASTVYRAKHITSVQSSNTCSTRRAHPRTPVRSSIARTVRHPSAAPISKVAQHKHRHSNHLDPKPAEKSSEQREKKPFTSSIGPSNAGRTSTGIERKGNRARSASASKNSPDSLFAPHLARSLARKATALPLLQRRRTSGLLRRLYRRTSTIRIEDNHSNPSPVPRIDRARTRCGVNITSSTGPSGVGSSFFCPFLAAQHIRRTHRGFSLFFFSCSNHEPAAHFLQDVWRYL